MRSLLLILFALMLNFMWINAATIPVKIRRICHTGNGKDNTLFWYPTIDTCTSFQKYYIWARNGKSGPFLLIDSISNKAAETYTHVDANLTAGGDWYYIIQNTDSCGPNFVASSDTTGIDKDQLFPSFIDSVSVDILTNKIIIGWHHNEAPDFALYDPQIYDNALNPKQFPGFPGTRDTFFVDTSSNPSLRSFRYDLNTRDSCGNSGIFGDNPHQTIFLSTQRDTCKKTCLLTWTPYSFLFIRPRDGQLTQAGWKRVLKYYIFKKIDANPLVLFDSVSGFDTTYLDNIILGQQVQYYVRAIKDTSILVTSSSNLCSFSTRIRTDPLNTELLNVSVDPITNVQIIVTFKKKTEEEWASYDLFRSLDSLTFLQTQTSLNNSGSQDSVFSLIDLVDATAAKYYYKVHSFNLCGIDVMSTDISNSILLKASPVGKENQLSWNKYDYWPIGVEKYRIYRGVKLNNGTISFALYDSVLSSEFSYLDKDVPEKIEGQGLCYYVQAAQIPGSLYPEVSNSNHSCIIGDLIVYVPNAFNPIGVNITFRPEGSFIDYKNSSMEIYDRWGGKVIEIMDITNGWDGKDIKGQYCMPGVYFYKIKIIGTNGREQTKSGLVTLLN